MKNIFLFLLGLGLAFGYSVVSAQLKVVGVPIKQFQQIKESLQIEKDSYVNDLSDYCNSHGASSFNEYEMCKPYISQSVQLNNQINVQATSTN
jgi:hypothetical protein